MSKKKIIACISGANAGLIALSAKEAETDASTKKWQNIAVVGKWKGHANGAFELKLEDLEQIVSNFKSSEANEIVADYEHATLYAEKAPASGWIKELRVKDNSLQAKIEWLDKAKESIKSGEYKYLSPVINPHTIDQVSGDDIGWSLHSVALTNKPFFEELDEVKINKNPIQNKENTLNEEQLKELEKLREENKELRAENVELKKAKAEAKIDEAVAAKKIHPDQKDSLMAFSASDPEGFEKFLETAKEITTAPGSDDMFAGSQGSGGSGEPKYNVLKLGGIE